MASQLTPHEMQLLQAHLAKFPRQAPCPICHTNHWTVAGIDAGISLTSAGAQLSAPMMPVVHIFCTQCGFLRQFVWRLVNGEFRV